MRRRVVDATVLASRVPATEPPPFEVAEGVRCIPVGELVGVAEPPAGFVIIGAGKTAMDACTWLLEQGTPPDAITWIRPRDGWLMNRAPTSSPARVRSPPSRVWSSSWRRWRRAAPWKRPTSGSNKTR